MKLSLLIAIIFILPASLYGDQRGGLGMVSAASSSLSLIIPARIELKRQDSGSYSEKEVFCVGGIGVRAFYPNLHTSSETAVSLALVSSSGKRRVLGNKAQPVAVSSDSLRSCGQGSAADFIEVSSLRPQDTIFVAEPL